MKEEARYTLVVLANGFSVQTKLAGIHLLCSDATPTEASRCSKPNRKGAATVPGASGVRLRSISSFYEELGVLAKVSNGAKPMIMAWLIALSLSFILVLTLLFSPQCFVVYTYKYKY